MREAVQKGQNGTGPYVLEASKGGCSPDSSCIASYLLAATEYTYLGCLSDEPQLPYYPDLARPLGKPLADAAPDADGVWTRQFEFGAVARWYPQTNRGTVQWRGDPMPPVPPIPPPTNVSRECGKALHGTTLAYDDVAPPANATTPEDCCNQCTAAASAKCVGWAWHGQTVPGTCHLHGAQSNARPQDGTISGYMRT
jgi:hypothetical protein